jgi:benzoyl-CoA reductase/2-hydroxyglutaryl-CoA dehydratase subunit BcrC/BadD/HgdB
MKKKRLLTARGELMEIPMSWEQQEVFRLLKSQPGTVYQEADVEGRKYFRDWVRGLLDVAEITVTFVKADGTVRDMRCTLNRDFIPTQPPRAEKPAKELPVDGIVRESQEVTKPEENHTQKVFDLDAFAWRSFRYDRLKKVTATLSFE